MLIKRKKALDHEATRRESFENLRKYDLRLNSDLENLWEKLMFALIVACQKLKPYFEAHQIEVVMDQPLRQIMENTSRSGRIVKWAIELSEFDPRYKPRMRIKAQALPDFVVECTHGPIEEALGYETLPRGHGGSMGRRGSLPAEGGDATECEGGPPNP
ncbi:hypothetical protein LIER_20563 [Lithospermum erythrorhizon]|uniref:Reverse transcriptase RNase H-like domain-containing protein n=1 Tax=Lithospermum erythrorhizon TaxID=34254 RepID=A0AAV3QLX0_LITER